MKTTMAVARFGRGRKLGLVVAAIAALPGHSQAGNEQPEPARAATARSMMLRAAASVAGTSFTPDGRPRGSACFVPNPTPAELEEIMGRFRALPPPLTVGFQDRYYTAGTVWTGAGSQGPSTRATAASLTYSFPNDGTTWGDGQVGPSSPNDLNAHLTALFGATALDRGREYIRQGLASWRRFGALTYTEVADDNVAFTESTANVATRGNTRIGSNPQGTSGTLAYNLFPTDGSDMTLNSDYFVGSAFSDAGSNYRYLRNVVAHEHGHGLGFIHPVPCNNTKLMEPFISLAFDMTQLEEWRGMGRNYGDRFMGNNSGAAARDFGNLTTPSLKSIVEQNLSTNGTGGFNNSDEDWFKFTLSSSQAVTISTAPLGSSITMGQQSGGCSGTTATVEQNVAGNLNIELRNGSNGATVLQTANAAAAGATETLSAGTLAAGTYWVRVVDAGPNDSTDQFVQIYNLTIRVATAKAPPTAIAGLHKRVQANTVAYFMGNVNSYTNDTDAGGSQATISTYAWDLDGDGTFEVANNPSPTRSPGYVSNGTYPVTLRVTDENGQADTDTINVVVFGATTTVTSVVPNNANQGQTIPVTINGTNLKNVTAANVTVSGSGVTVTGTAVPNALGTQVTGLSFVIGGAATIGARNVTITNADGTGTGTGVFTVNSGVCVGAGVSTPPSPQSVCPGGTAIFSVVASGSTPINYQWRKNGADITGENAPTLTISGVVAGDAASYTCAVSNSCGNAVSAAALLSLLIAPSATDSPDSITRCSGASAEFSVTFTGSPAPGLQWRKNGTNIAGATGSTFSIPSVLVGDAGSYDCVATNTCGSDTSASAVLTVQVPVGFVFQPENQTVCQGEFTTIAVTPSGTGPFTYSWRKNGNPIGGFSATYSINPVEPTHAGNYDCVVTNACGSATSSVAVLTVTALPAVTTSPVSVAVCPGDPASFTVVATGAAPLSYQWQKDGADVAGATSPTLNIPSVAAGNAGAYWCVVTNSCGSTFSDAATLTLGGGPTITTQPSPATVCEGQPASFTIVATGTGTITYQWRKGGVDVSGATSATYNLATVAIGDAGSYDCVATTCAGATSNAALLTVNSAPSITTQPSGVSGCEGSGVTLSVVAAGTAPLSYQWRKNSSDIPSATGASLNFPSLAAADAASYDCVVTNSCGNLASDPAVIDVQPGPSIDTHPTGGGVCEDGTINLTVAASGATGFQWRKSGSPLVNGPTGSGSSVAGATTASLSITTAGAADADSYTCEVSAACGSVVSNPAVISIIALPSITTHPASQTKCLNGSAMFTVAASGGSLAYQWRKGGSPIGGETAPSITVNPVNAAAAGSYDCVVTNGCGSVSSNAAVLTLCIGDFNCSGTISVQDIFDFLATYFSNGANSDVNASGSITVQDIFDFLAAYFAGCAF
ncbi:MAG: immunoglobulin domain-containing protein [Phycisphaerales bacterium]|nr:immunoglobulin domain-containing protein [Phycisphaerales bacterium]